jgi:acyl phosphate:glycerol-3-phosphate acyltransferase
VIVSTVLAYLLGGLPFGYWFVRLVSGRDIRTMGSGNIGATNVQRSMGMKAGLAVLFLDIFKGFLAVWVAAVWTHSNAAALALAVAAVMLGHCYPIFLRFKGGKAVACFVGAFLYLAPLALLATTAVFVLVVAATKYVSLGSILGAFIFPFALWSINRPPRSILYASIFAAVLVIYRHKGNIARLRTGKENRFGRK